MKELYFVITNSGDGSNGIMWVKDQKVLDFMEELVDADNETFASGDGLQVKTLKFNDDFDLDQFMLLNNIKLTTLKSMGHDD